MCTYMPNCLVAILMLHEESHQNIANKKTILFHLRNCLSLKKISCITFFREKNILEY